MAIKNLPTEAQPREKLLARGPAALADAELLAILLRTGIVGKGVLQMAQELLDPPVLDPASGKVSGVPAGEIRSPTMPMCGRLPGSIQVTRSPAR